MVDNFTLHSTVDGHTEIRTIGQMKRWKYVKLRTGPNGDEHGPNFKDLKIGEMVGKPDKRTGLYEPFTVIRATRAIKEDGIKKTIEIMGISKPYEDFIITDEDDNTYYIEEEELLSLLPKKVLVKLTKKRTRTWAKIIL